MIKLSDVTLIGLTGRDTDAETMSALAIQMQKEIVFGAVKVIWDGQIKTIDDWNYKICFDLWKYFDTTHCFLFHPDGYIIHPELWNDEWLKLDYIGSPWPLPQDDYSYRDIYGKIQRVGNSVGLRSRKLLKLPTELNLEFKPFYGNTNEDGKLCVEWRTILEQHGCKFATFEQALKFGKEHDLPENKDLKTFCYHSPF